MIPSEMCWGKPLFACTCCKYNKWLTAVFTECLPAAGWTVSFHTVIETVATQTQLSKNHTSLQCPIFPELSQKEQLLIDWHSINRRHNHVSMRKLTLILPFVCPVQCLGVRSGHLLLLKQAKNQTCQLQVLA